MLTKVMVKPCEASLMARFTDGLTWPWRWRAKIRACGFGWVWLVFCSVEAIVGMGKVSGGGVLV